MNCFINKKHVFICVIVLIQILMPQANFSVSVANAATKNNLLISTSEFDLNDRYLREKANDLNNDPQLIYEYVRDEIQYEVYEGSLRGSRGTLWSKAGNGLDQASLLIGLLRVSGIPARYVRGSLDPLQSQQLIASMFDLPLQVMGCPLSDTERADPVNNQTLLTESGQHFWVEFETVNGFVEADPSFSDAVLGTRVGSRLTTFEQVPDTLKHTVNIKLITEKNNFFSASIRKKDTVIDSTFVTASLVGKPLSITHFVSSNSVGGLVGSTVTHNYRPIILIGENDSTVDDDELVLGIEYQELASTLFSIGNTVLLGVFVEINVISPSGKRQTYQRPLLDRIGFSARNTNTATAIDNIDIQKPALSEVDVMTINVLPGLQHTDVFSHQEQRLAPIQAKHNVLLPEISTLPESGQLNPEQIQVVAQADALGRNIAIVGAESTGMHFIATADELLRQLQLNYQVKAYFDSPRLLITQVKESSDQFSIALDIRKNDLRVLPIPGQIKAAPWYFEIARGLIESQLEVETMHSVPGKNFAAIDVFSQLPDDATISGISDENFKALETIVLSEQARARISQAIHANKFILVPEKPVFVEGQERFAWLEIDKSTGHTIAVAEDGGHQALFEYAFEAKYAIQQAGFVGGFSSAFFSGTIGFVGGLLQGINENRPIKQVVEEGKYNMLTSLIKTLILFDLPDPGLKVYLSCVDQIPDIDGFGKCLSLEAAQEILSSLPGFPAKPWTIGGIFGSISAITVIQSNANIDPTVFPFLSTLHNFSHSPIDVSSAPTLNASISLDSLLTYPASGFSNLPLQSVYQLSIQNLGPNPEAVDIKLNTPSPDFTIRGSLDQLVIPPGEKGQINVCLAPVDDTITQNTAVPFNVTIDGSSGVSQSLDTTLNIPPIISLALETDPVLLSILPGQAVPVNLTVSNIGNVNAENIPLVTRSLNNLTVTGLPSQITLIKGDTKTIPITLAPSANAELGRVLTTSVIAKFGKDQNGNPFEASTLIIVNIGITPPITQDIVAPKLLIVPSHLGLTPNQQTELIVRLENTSARPIPLQLSLDTLPEGVTAQLNRPNITLAPGEVLNSNSTNPVKIMLNQSLTANQVFTLKLLASSTDFPDLQLTASSLFSIHQAFADVTDVIVTPAVVNETDKSISLQATVFNTANTTRSVLAQLEILDNNNAVVKTLPEVPLALAPALKPETFQLGNTVVDNLADGFYQLRVSLLDSNRAQIPGRSSTTTFFVGTAVKASVQAEPSLVPPGDSSVNTVIKISNLLTPFQNARESGDTEGLVNLFLELPVTVKASSSSVRSSFENIVDGSQDTLWLTAFGETSNLGKTPFIEVQFDEECDCVLKEIRMAGDRPPSSFEIFSGIFEVFDEMDTLLFSTGEIEIPEPNRDIFIPVPNLTKVKRIRFTTTNDENNRSGFSELVAFGTLNNPQNEGLKADFVFVMDGSRSMLEELNKLKDGLSQLSQNLINSGINARYAVLGFGGQPSLCLPFTRNLEILKKALERPCARIGQEAGLEAVRLALNSAIGLENSLYPALEYRPDARKILILATDEYSHRPWVIDNRLPGQGSSIPSDIAGTDWQIEIDNTAQAIIDNQAFINLIVLDDGPAFQQYGNPASDASDPDFLNYDGQTTLQNLESTGFGNSLVAQVLRAGLVGRAFDIGKIDDPNFVNNFFNAKIEEVVNNAPRIQLEITHTVTQDGYTIIPNSITPAFSELSEPIIRWQTELVTGINPDGTFIIPGTVTSMQPGESRDISTGTQVKVTFRDLGNQEITQTFALDPVIVTAAHIITLDPLTRTTDAGSTASYDVLLNNPGTVDQTYSLSVVGLEDLNLKLASTVTVAASSSVKTPLTINSISTSRGTRDFIVQAQTATGGIDRVQGSLSLTGKDVTITGIPDNPLNVDLQLIPGSDVAGQNTTATFIARITNIGNQPETFQLTGSYPAGFFGDLSETTVTLLPGNTNFRDVPLKITPGIGTTPGAYTFSLKATAVTDETVDDQASAAVNVLDLELISIFLQWSIHQAILSI